MDGHSFTLVVAEKPSVAKNIASVVTDGMQKKNGYFEGSGYLISWCLGHLAEPAQPETYREEWKRWELDSLPILPDQWKYVVKEKTKGQYKVLRQLLHREDVTNVVCATDAGREGELIFRLVYELSGCRKPVSRLWISSMEENAIRDGLNHLQPGSNFDNLYLSALCRQKADWLVGINGTRLFTVLYGGRVLKVGRVQTPTLAMVVERENEINGFQKKKYYTVHLAAGGIDAATGRIEDKEKADKIRRDCQGSRAIVISVSKEEKSTAPPKLYDLTTLQRDANRLFGFTAKQTLEYLQSLYEKRLATYPRTDSQFLTEDMRQTAEGVIHAISSSQLFGEIPIHSPDVKRVLDSSKVTDHHAVIPTVEIAGDGIATLPETERRLLSLIACRLLCATGQEYLYETVKAELSCGGYTFTTSGKNVLQSGWREFEIAFRHFYKISGSQEEENQKKGMPKLLEGQVFDNVQANISEHFTKPPKHFTEDTLLLAMEHAGTEELCEGVERQGLGTPATRADIIEKLVRDGYARREKKYLFPTEDGRNLIEVLPDAVKSPKITAEWENSLALVAKGELPADEFIDGITKMVSGLVKGCCQPDAEQKRLFAKGNGHTILGKCPKCGADFVSGKFGPYCTGKCGMQVSRYFSTKFTDQQAADLLAGKKVLLKGVPGKNGKPYSLFLKPSGIEQYSYEKNEGTATGYQFSYEKSYPDRKRKPERGIEE